MTGKRKPLAITGAILAILLFFQNQGWIDITNVIPDDNPKPPVVVPDEPTPEPTPPTPSPGPVPSPNSEILIQIEEEGFPSLPPEIIQESLPIKEALLACNDPNKALLVARVYADWDTVMRLAWTPTELKTYGQFQQKHRDAIKGVLAKHKLTTLCTNFGKIIDQVIISQVGEHGESDLIKPDEYEKIANAFQAISARAYEAFQELIK